MSPWTKVWKNGILDQVSQLLPFNQWLGCSLHPTQSIQFFSWESILDMISVTSRTLAQWILMNKPEFSFTIFNILLLIWQKWKCLQWRRLIFIQLSPLLWNNKRIWELCGSDCEKHTGSPEQCETNKTEGFSEFVVITVGQWSGWQGIKSDS